MNARVSGYLQSCAAAIIGGLVVFVGSKVCQTQEAGSHSLRSQDNSLAEDVLRGRKEALTALLLNDTGYYLCLLDMLNEGKLDDLREHLMFRIYDKGGMLGGESLQEQIPVGRLRKLYLHVWQEWGKAKPHSDHIPKSDE